MSSMVRRLELIDQRRVALLDELATLDSAVLAAHPRPGKWSIGEIVEHLILSERDVLHDLPDPAELTTRAQSFRNHLLYGLVMFILRFDVPVKAPSRGMLPRGGRPFHELREMWDTNHRWIRACLGNLDGAGWRRPVFMHPVTGPLTPAQAVRMLDVHLDRHIRQIRRLQRMLQSSP